MPRIRRKAGAIAGPSPAERDRSRAEKAALEAENPVRMGAGDGPRNGIAVQVFVRSGAQAHYERRMDPAGDRARVADLHTMAGVEMRLTAGGVRELHWHVEAEWAIMLYGNARITAVDQARPELCQRHRRGRPVAVPERDPPFDSGPGTGWLQVPARFRRRELQRVRNVPDYRLVGATPKEVLAKNFNVAKSTFDKVPKEELFIFQAGLPGDLKAEQTQAAQGTGVVTNVSTSGRAR